MGQFPSTLLSQSNEALDIQKGQLDLLDKLNKLSSDISGASKQSIKTLSSTGYTITDNDGIRFILCTTGSVNQTIILPTLAANQGRTIAVVKMDSGAGKVVVDGEGSEKIGVEGNALTFDLYSQGDYVIVTGATAWAVLGTNGPILKTITDGQLIQNSPAASTWYNIGGSLAVPPGVWNLMYQANMASSSNGEGAATLSTGNNSESDREMTVTAPLDLLHLVTRHKRVVVAASSTYYLNAQVHGGGYANVFFYGAVAYGYTVITAQRVG